MEKNSEAHSSVGELESKNSPIHPDQRGANKKEGFLKEMFRFALIVLLIVLPIRLFIAQPFVVSGASMEPTFLDGEYLIVDEVTYRFEDPSRGDIVIFKLPGVRGTYLIKRIIGLPNETIAVHDGIITITNESTPEGFVLDEPYLKNKMDRPESITTKLGSDQYFVMGDNRPKSADSRSWGPLNEEKIIGRPLVRLFPFNKIDVLPGVYEIVAY